MVLLEVRYIYEQVFRNMILFFTKRSKVVKLFFSCYNYKLLVVLGLVLSKKPFFVEMTKYISKAPLRIGLAGGGTDVSPYSDIYNGAILNATIDLYANVLIIPKDNGLIVFRDFSTGNIEKFELANELPTQGSDLKLQIGVYNRLVKDYGVEPFSCEVITHLDVPSGSGLGTSSAIMVATIGAFVECYNLPLGEYDIAKLAVSIERGDLSLSGGKQDQYAATFGGMNFMEFYAEDRVIVNPLRIKESVLTELEFHLLLFYTQTSRESASIIDDQKLNIEKKQTVALEATHKLKEQAFKMKEAILKNQLPEIGEILDFGWKNKKKLAGSISNNELDDIYDAAISAGASGGKISGAGGGGFMMFYCPGESKYDVIEAVAKKKVSLQQYHFQSTGLLRWTSYQ